MLRNVKETRESEYQKAKMEGAWFEITVGHHFAVDFEDLNRKNELDMVDILEKTVFLVFSGDRESETENVEKEGGFERVKLKSRLKEGGLRLWGYCRRGV